MMRCDPEKFPLSTFFPTQVEAKNGENISSLVGVRDSAVTMMDDGERQ